MNKLRYSLLLAGALLATGGNAQELGNDHWNTLQRYCSKCHNTDDFSGGFAIDQLNPGDLHSDAALWEKVVRKLRSGMMPPPGQDRPAVTDITRVVSGLETALDKAAARHPNPGAVVLHRMNRNEYANAVRDLLAVPVNGEQLLPADDSASGFDNIASALVLSPALMQSYITAASRISRLAVGDMGSSPVADQLPAAGRHVAVRAHRWFAARHPWRHAGAACVSTGCRVRIHHPSQRPQ